MINFASMNADNPILRPSDAPHGAPRFDLFRLDDYLPAFDAALQEARSDIDAIAANPAPPDFDNTIAALDYAGRSLGRVEGIFFNLLEAEGGEAMQAIAEAVVPKLTDFQLYTLLNRPLFERVKVVHDAAPSLTPEQQRLLDDTWRSFVRGGAQLPEAERERYRTWKERLSLLELKFGDHLLHATHAFSLHLRDAAELAGLPPSVVAAAREAAAEKQLEGWLITLDAPSAGPFLTFSERRELREQVWRAQNSRCNGGPFDNTAIVREIVELRARMAQLLGYPSYADYALEERMAKSVPAVQAFLERLMAPSLPAARAEIAALEQFARSRGFAAEKLMPWDFRFWAEKFRQAHFALDTEALRPYFPLDACIGALFDLAARLYGLSFRERGDLPVYHPDVRVYEVLDADGSFLALFYADFFPRPTKRGGAWMTEFRTQCIEDGEDKRPFVSLVTNLSKATAETPSLLTHEELVTLLHEFGHSLHGILSKGRYPSLCGTNVARDFVELPSQLLENWAYEPAFLQGFARHYRSGEPLPAEVVERLVAARNFLSAFYQVRQLRFGLIDMAWHTLRELPQAGTVAFEAQVLAPYETLPQVDGSAISPAFGHIFDGGYSAGYYSYKWAEVLEADAFDAFRDAGIFDRGVAARFRHEILEKGSSEDEALLYRRFRGHDPDPAALLRKLGI